ncbi:Calreticulin family-domain-containing protein [Ephemerocybe angulata]|uniref:Calreticulin family-domain-containing protein n=1 Tax=Ephemerocybe angulata TaxID=980116 RepID=A0A8H6M141_9AGAR|nr:Calreticulin family-domain-containing protein [Tulosesus angulatus]
MASFEDYDEFGNYIGADLESDEEDEIPQNQFLRDTNQGPSAPLEGYEDEPMREVEEEGAMEVDEPPAHNAVILHEDKQYYPSASDVYGEGVETLVQEEDAQPLTEPIIAPVKMRKWTVEEKDMPETRFDKRPSFLLNMTAFPEMIRNVAVVGHLHHGKTALLDMLVYETHKLVWDADKSIWCRYGTPIHISSPANAKSLSNPNQSPSSSPRRLENRISFTSSIRQGHVNFADEVASAARLVDGILLVVDVVEGLMVGAEMILRHAIQEGLKITLVVNKIDRTHSGTENQAHRRLNRPEPGAEAQPMSLETLPSRARTSHTAHSTFKAFADRLWGDIYTYKDDGKLKFTRKAEDPEAERTFVKFILNPLYKIYSHVLSEESDDLKETLRSLGIQLKNVLYKMDTRPLLKVVLDQFFGPATGLVDVIVNNIPSPAEHTADKSLGANGRTRWKQRTQDPQSSDLVKSMKACDPEGPLDGRVRSLKVLGEGYSPEDEEDYVGGHCGGHLDQRSSMKLPPVTSSSLEVSTPQYPRHATLAATNIDEDLHIFRPIKHYTESVLKIAIEPIAPSELPKMLSGLRSINKSYPLVSTKVEESGEHVLIGTGELYLDCVMHDLRRLFSEIEIKVSDPVVKFCETVLETSALKCYADTPNKKNRITMIAEPLERGIAEDIESGRVNMRMSAKERGKFFEEKYQWDLLASRSIWAFGPDDSGPNILLDDTLPSQVGSSLNTPPKGSRGLIVMRSPVRTTLSRDSSGVHVKGRYADEPMRNVKFRLLDATLAQEPIFRGGGQIVPTARRATPRLMEPVYYVEVQAPADCISAVYTVLARRRGHVTQDIPKAGSPLYTVKALIPVIDANGFETDLRTATQGDPTDASIKLRPLEPASGQALARDLVLKTRRRKGLGDQIAVSKYLDDEFVICWDEDSSSLELIYSLSVIRGSDAFARSVPRRRVVSDRVTISALVFAVAALANADAPKPAFTSASIKAPFLEQFTDDWTSRWTPSEATKKTPVGGETFSYVGQWAVEDPSSSFIEGDKGLVAKSKAAHHAISAPFSKPVDFKTKPLVVQYEVKYQKGGNCGGGYLKLLEDGFQTSGKEFSDTTPWVVMFGPDLTCPGTKVHFIVRAKNPKTGVVEEKHLKPAPTPSIEKLTNLYTLILQDIVLTFIRSPNNTYNVLVNGQTEKTANPPTGLTEEKIPDPDAKKPEEWDEDAPYEIKDEEAVKPEGWLDDEPSTVPDPDATKPEESTPTGAASGPAPLIDNPAYKGEWAPRKIPNPAFFEDKAPVKSLPKIGGVGIELWTMTEDILFDNIYVGHSVEDAKKLAAETFRRSRSPSRLPLTSPPMMTLTMRRRFPFKEDPIEWIRSHLLDFVDCRESAKKTDAVTPDDKKKTQAAPVAPAGETKKDDEKLKKRK